MPFYDDCIIAVALREESQGLLERAGAQVVYTGLGKVNAAYAMARAIADHRARRGDAPVHVVNFGTVGSPRFSTHTLVECTASVQRDMDVTALGFALGHTPFDEHPGELRARDRVLPQLPGAVCGTGDLFETRVGTGGLALAPVLVYDIVDMEAYALAKVCLREGIPFTSVKYVTDGADPVADKDWARNVLLAAPRFVEALTLLFARNPALA